MLLTQESRKDKQVVFSQIFCGSLLYASFSMSIKGKSAKILKITIYNVGELLVVINNRHGGVWFAILFNHLFSMFL